MTGLGMDVWMAVTSMHSEYALRNVVTLSLSDMQHFFHHLSKQENISYISSSSDRHHSPTAQHDWDIEVETDQLLDMLEDTTYPPYVYLPKSPHPVAHKTAERAADKTNSKGYVYVEIYPSAEADIQTPFLFVAQVDPSMPSGHIGLHHVHRQLVQWWIGDMVRVRMLSATHLHKPILGSVTLRLDTLGPCIHPYSIHEDQVGMTLWKEFAHDFNPAKLGADSHWSDGDDDSGSEEPSTGGDNIRPRHIWVENQVILFAHQGCLLVATVLETALLRDPLSPMTEDAIRARNKKSTCSGVFSVGTSLVFELGLSLKWRNKVN